MMTRREVLTRLAGAWAVINAGAHTSDVFSAAPERSPTEREPSLPDWVPASGTRKNISRNVLADVDPCPARDCTYSGIIGQRAVLSAWSGAAFATAYGRLGA